MAGSDPHARVPPHAAPGHCQVCTSHHQGFWHHWHWTLLDGGSGLNRSLQVMAQTCSVHFPAVLITQQTRDGNGLIQRLKQHGIREASFKLPETLTRPWFQQIGELQKDSSCRGASLTGPSLRVPKSLTDVDLGRQRG